MSECMLKVHIIALQRALTKVEPEGNLPQGLCQEGVHDWPRLWRRRWWFCTSLSFSCGGWSLHGRRNGACKATTDMSRTCMYILSMTTQLLNVE